MARLCFECCRCSWRLVPMLQLTFPGRSLPVTSLFQEVRIELLQPIGEHPRVQELFREITCHYARE